MNDVDKEVGNVSKNVNLQISELDLWRLCDELTVIEAALLLCSPDLVDFFQSVESWSTEKRPKGYEAAKKAIINAFRDGEITGKHTVDIPSLQRSPFNIVIDVASLRAWLKRRGVRSGFFFPEESDTPSYLDSNHPNFAPKLAAAVKVWEAVSGEPDLMRGKTPKQAMMKWLRQHANDFGLIKEDGSPNETGIEEVAKVANWQEKGGAPKTP